jgi:D-glycerate 3-kinase
MTDDPIIAHRPALIEVLSLCALGHSLTSSELEHLECLTLADSLACQAFGVSVDNIKRVVQERIQLLQAIYPDLNQFCCSTLGWAESPLHTLWYLWLPLAMQLADGYRALRRPLIQGVLGGQGTGKTTLAAVLSLILQQLGYRVCSLSLDDLYKPYKARLKLQEADPRLRWRGPPGTHDVELGIDVLKQLQTAAANQPVAIPRFDKSAWDGAGDRTDPEWVQNVHIVLFEGWFVGVRPIVPETFDHSPEPIVSAADRTFARDMNQRLQDYLPLWDQLDRLMILCPEDYRLSQQWRREAEHRMKAAGKSGMSDEEIDQFVMYFWKALHPELFIAPLLRNSDYVDLVVEINRNHTPATIYCPARFTEGI